MNTWEFNVILKSSENFKKIPKEIKIGKTLEMLFSTIIQKVMNATVSKVVNRKFLDFLEQSFIRSLLFQETSLTYYDGKFSIICR